MYTLSIQKFNDALPAGISIYYDESEDKLKEFMKDELIPKYMELIKIAGGFNSDLSIIDDIGVASISYDIDINNDDEYHYCNIEFMITEAHDTKKVVF